MKQGQLSCFLRLFKNELDSNPNFHKAVLTAFLPKSSKVGAETDPESGPDRSRLNRIALIAMIVTDPEGAEIKRQYNQGIPHNDLPSIASGDGCKSHRNAYYSRLMERGEVMKTDRLLINLYDPTLFMDDGGLNPNGWEILKDVHPERGNIASPDEFHRDLTAISNSYLQLTSRLNQSDRHESERILDATALQFCSNSTFKATDVALFFTYLHWKDKDLSTVVRKMPPGIGRANGFPDDRVPVESVNQQISSAPTTEPLITSHRKRKIREMEKQQQTMQRGLQLGIAAYHAQVQASGSSGSSPTETITVNDELAERQLEVAQSVITRNLLAAEESKLAIAAMAKDAIDRKIRDLREAINDPSFKTLSKDLQGQLKARLEAETTAALLAV